MMSKIWTNGDAIILLSKKIVEKGNFSFHNVFKSCLWLMHQTEYQWSKGLRLQEQGLSDKRLNPV